MKVKQMVRALIMASIVTVMLASVAGAANLAVPNPGTANSNIFLMNMGDSDATVVTDFIDPTSGDTVDSQQITLGSQIGAMILSTDIGVNDGWIGSAVVSSDQPMGAIVNLLYGNGTAAAYTGVSAASPEVYLPDVRRSDSRLTRFSVQNTDSTTAATVYLHYYNRNGVEVIPTNAAHRVVTIEPLRQMTFSLADINIDLSTTLGIGSMYITSTLPIAANATLHSSNQTGAYTGISTGDTTLWFPGCIRWPNTTPNQFTSMIVQNTGDQDAIVRFEILDRNNNVNYVFTDTIPSAVAYGFNFLNLGASMDQTTWNAMIAAMIAGSGGNAGWKGSVRAISTNGQPLVGVGIFFTNMVDNLYFNAIGESEATTGDLAFPVAKRYLTGTASEQFTIHVVQNLDDEAATVDVTTYDRYGAVVSGPTQVTVPANGSVAFNLQKVIDLPQADLDEMGTAFSGSMYVTGDGVHRIIGLAYQYFPNGNKAMGYNAFVP